MVLGTGIDVLAIDRVRRELACADWTPADGVFRNSELRNCHDLHSPAGRLAECFVVKEAAIKALGVRVSDLGIFREVEVLHTDAGSLTVSLHGRIRRRSRFLGVRNVLAASHADRYLAAAMVILEG